MDAVCMFGKAYGVNCFIFQHAQCKVQGLELHPTLNLIMECHFVATNKLILNLANFIAILRNIFKKEKKEGENFLLLAGRELDDGVGGDLLLCIMSRKWPHPCSITWRLPGSLFSKQLPASFCACPVRRLVRPRRWSELSSAWCAVFDKIWVLHTPARFARGRSSFTVYNWSSPAQRPCHFLHESCLAKTVVCAECLQLVQITTTLHRFSFENLECYKPQDLIMLISFANTELIMAFASWKTSFRSYSFICIVRFYLLWIFQLAVHHIPLQITSSLLGRDLVAIQGVCVCLCVCICLLKLSFTSYISVAISISHIVGWAFCELQLCFCHAKMS